MLLKNKRAGIGREPCDLLQLLDLVSNCHIKMDNVAAMLENLPDNSNAGFSVWVWDVLWSRMGQQFSMTMPTAKALSRR